MNDSSFGSCAGELLRDAKAPKEQPPRKLSGHRDRAAGTGTLESAAPHAGDATEGVRFALQSAPESLRYPRQRGHGEGVRCPGVAYPCRKS
ncbi:hypothetical protein ERY430_41420 [Erythrobacter sp. EC-HK427]|nr:hypothetical protein ERY430_41420 [Erythrobacter sp. EC-HK427]